MRTSAKFSRIAAAVALSIGLSSTAMAQVTSSELNGKIMGPQGNPAAGTVVTVTHVPTALVVHTQLLLILMNSLIKQSTMFT